MATTNWNNVNKNIANFATQMQNILANKQAKAKGEAKAQRQNISDKNSAFDRRKQNLNDLISGVENKISGLRSGDIYGYEEEEINNLSTKLEEYEGQRMALLEGNYEMDEDFNIKINYEPPQRSANYVGRGTQLKTQEDFKASLDIINATQNATISQLRQISGDFNQNIRPKLNKLNKKEAEYTDYSIKKEKFDAVKANLNKSQEQFLRAKKMLNSKEISSEQMEEIKDKTKDHYKNKAGVWQKIYFDDFGFADYSNFKATNPKPPMTKDDIRNKNIYLQGLVKILKMKYPTYNINVDNVETVDNELTKVWNDLDISVDFNSAVNEIVKQRNAKKE